MAKGNNSHFKLATKRYLTSVRMWLYSAPFFIVGIVFTEENTQADPNHALKALGIGLAGHLALGLVIFISSKTVLKPSKRETAGWREVLGVLGVAAVFRSLAIGATSEALAVGNWDLLVRTPTSIGLVLFSYTLACSSSERWASYREKRNELLYSMAISQRSEDSLDLAPSGNQDFRKLEREISSLQAKTRESLAKFKQMLREGDSGPQDLETLISSTDKQWRDMSHNAWNSGKPSIPAISVLEIIRTMAISKPISLLVLALGPIYSFFRIFLDLGVQQATSVFFFWFSLSSAIAWSTNQISANSKRFAVVVFGIGYAALLVVGVLIGVIYLGSDELKIHQAFVVFASSFAAVAIGIGPALERGGQHVLDQLEQMLGSSTLKRLRIQNEMFLLARTIGAYLHSDLRGDFMRMAIELRQALESGNIGLADSIVTQMEARVRGEQLVKNLRSSKANLEEFLSNWGKVIKVRSNISEVAIPESIQATVESIIMEAVNDAVRHGSASWVDVRLGRDVNQITIQVESDSSPDSNSPSIGIGSQTLAQVAPNSWSRGFSESGNYVLTARL